MRQGVQTVVQAEGTGLRGTLQGMLVTRPVWYHIVFTSFYINTLINFRELPLVGPPESPGDLLGPGQWFGAHARGMDLWSEYHGHVQWRLCAGDARLALGQDLGGLIEAICKCHSNNLVDFWTLTQAELNLCVWLQRSFLETTGQINQRSQRPKTRNFRYHTAPPNSTTNSQESSAFVRQPGPSPPFGRISGLRLEPGDPWKRREAPVAPRVPGGDGPWESFGEEKGCQDVPSYEENVFVGGWSSWSSVKRLPTKWFPNFFLAKLRKHRLWTWHQIDGTFMYYTHRPKWPVCLFLEYDVWGLPGRRNHRMMRKSAEGAEGLQRLEAPCFLVCGGFELGFGEGKTVSEKGVQVMWSWGLETTLLELLIEMPGGSERHPAAAANGEPRRVSTSCVVHFAYFFRVFVLKISSFGFSNSCFHGHPWSRTEGRSSETHLTSLSLSVPCAGDEWDVKQYDGSKQHGTSSLC